MISLLIKIILSVSAEIKVGFTLEKPVSFLTSHIDKLGNDIFEEIGVPNSKVLDAFSLSLSHFFCLQCLLIIISFFPAGFHCFNASFNF